MSIYYNDIHSFRQIFERHTENLLSSITLTKIKYGGDFWEVLERERERVESIIIHSAGF